MFFWYLFNTQFIDFCIESKVKTVIRTFLALPLEIQVSLKTTCSALQEQFSSEKLRWVTHENMHLTIRFFGDVEEDQVEVMADALTAAIRDVTTSDIVLKGLGTFENSSAYNVLWAGIEDQEALREIKRLTDEALEGILPIKTHRRYRPHLTLARMKKIYDRERFMDAIAQNETKDFGTYKLDRLVLFQSILGECGPVYRELRKIKLGERKVQKGSRRP